MQLQLKWFISRQNIQKLLRRLVKFQTSREKKENVHEDFKLLYYVYLNKIANTAFCKSDSCCLTLNRIIVCCYWQKHKYKLPWKCDLARLVFLQCSQKYQHLIISFFSRVKHTQSYSKPTWRVILGCGCPCFVPVYAHFKYLN